MIDLLLRLAPRERLLIGCLLALVPAVLWITWGEPLISKRAASAAALQDAQALGVWVEARIAEKQALAQLGDTGPRAPIGLSALEQSLISARLRDAVSTLSNQGAGGIELGFEAVEFEALMRWLGASDPGWGYDIESFRILGLDEEGIVAADLRLSPQT